MTQQSNKNNIPKHWQVKKLGEVADYINGRAFKPTEWENSGVPIIRIQNLNKAEAAYNYSTKEFEEKYELKKGDLLYAWSASLGVYIWAGEKAWLNQHIFKVVPKSICDKKFLFYTLDEITAELYSKAHGSGMVHVTKGKFESTEILLPPLSEQLVLVSKIEELLSDLENGKQQLLTAQQQLKVYRQSLLKAAFEGRLTNKEVKEGELPKGWKWVTISDLAENNKHALKAGPFGSALKKEFYVETGYKIYGQEQVIIDNPYFGDYYVNEEKYQELKSCRIKPFDILISLVGTVGKVLILPENCMDGIINPRLIKISLNRQKYLPKFFKYYFESSSVKAHYKSQAQGTTMDVLNLGIIKKIPFTLTTLEEQQKVVDELESKLTVCDKIEETIAQSLQQSETLKQSILKKAFEGRLVSVEEEKVNTKLPNIQLQYPKIVDNITTTDLHAGIISMVIAAHEKNTHYLNRLNHVKCEKIAHMVEAKIGLSLGREPVKDAAGPDDYNHLTKVEHRANMANWFGCKKMGIGRTYYSKSGINNLIDKVRNTLKSEELNEIDKLIMTFLPFELEHAELIATIYAGWNNLLLYGQNPTDEEIVIESRENWSDRKLNIERDKFFKTLNWMRLHGFIPEGKGKLVLKNEKVTKTKKRNL